MIKKIGLVLGLSLLFVAACKKKGNTKTQQTDNTINDPATVLNGWTYLGKSKINFDFEIRNGYVSSTKMHVNNASKRGEQTDIIFTKEIFPNPWCTGCHHHESSRIILNKDKSAQLETKLYLFEKGSYLFKILPQFYVGGPNKEDIWCKTDFACIQPGYGAVEDGNVSGGNNLYEYEFYIANTFDLNPANAFIAWTAKNAATYNGRGGMIKPLLKGDGLFINFVKNKYGSDAGGATIGGAVLDDGRMVYARCYRDSVILLESSADTQKLLIKSDYVDYHPSTIRNMMAMSEIVPGATEANYRFSKWYREGDKLVILLAFNGGSKFIEMDIKTHQITLIKKDFPVFSADPNYQYFIHPANKEIVYEVKYETAYGYCKKISEIRKYDGNTYVQIPVPSYPADATNSFDQSFIVGTDKYYLLTRHNGSIFFYSRDF